MRKSSPHRGIKRGLLSLVAVAVAACGLLALNPGGTPVVHAATSTDRGSIAESHHDATIVAPAARPTRAHRLTPATGAFLAATVGATLVAFGVLRTRRRISTRRGEQFFVRRRGPPLHLVTM
jgi:hypothetical protein